MRHYVIIGGGHGLKLCPETFPFGTTTITVAGTYAKYKSDIIIDMHDIETIIDHHPEVPQEAVRNNVPYYTLEQTDKIPTSIRYPIENIVKFFQTDYLNSSIDYAIAFAIYQASETITLYGISLNGTDEYLFQKASCEYWLSRAIGMGIKVNVGDPQYTRLFHCQRIVDGKWSSKPERTMYGYWYKQHIPGVQDGKYKQILEER